MFVSGRLLRFRESVDRFPDIVLNDCEIMNRAKERCLTVSNHFIYLLSEVQARLT